MKIRFDASLLILFRTKIKGKKCWLIDYYSQVLVESLVRGRSYGGIIELWRCFGNLGKSRPKIPCYPTRWSRSEKASPSRDDDHEVLETNRRCCWPYCSPSKWHYLPRPSCPSKFQTPFIREKISSKYAPKIIIQYLFFSVKWDNVITLSPSLS